MKSKSQKLHEAYKHLRSIGRVHTHKDFSEQIPLNKTNLSSAFNGKDGYLTDDLFKKICNSFPEIFNIEYFLEDKEPMLKNNQRVGNVSNSTTIGNNVNGKGINITHNDLSEIIELQKGYQELLKKKDEHISELIAVISKLSDNEK